MNVPGSASIERKPAHWNRTLLDGYLSMAAIGVLCGIVVAYARTPIHLPGHKVLLWMTPILAARLATRTRAGASLGAFTTALTTLCLGGRIAGGVALMPLIVLAGVVLDWSVRIGEQRQFTMPRRLLLLAAAGMVGNLICFVKRLFDPLGAFFSVGNMNDLLTAAASHAVFGFLAGLLGAAAGFAVLSCRRKT